MADDTNPPERPRAEPEIIPPDRTGRRGWDAPFQNNRRPEGIWSQRVYVMRPGPLSLIGFALVLGLIVAAVFLAVIGTLLVWIPAVAVCVVIAAVYRFLRR